MKRISAGCRAVIVNSVAGNAGILVTVGEFVGKVQGWVGYDRWEVDKIVNGTYGDKACHIRERQLLRIDDAQQELGSWDQIEADCGYSPNREVVV